MLWYVLLCIGIDWSLYSPEIPRRSIISNLENKVHNHCSGRAKRKTGSWGLGCREYPNLNCWFIGYGISPIGHSHSLQKIKDIQSVKAFVS